MNEVRVWHEDDGYHVEAKECRGCLGHLLVSELAAALKPFDSVVFDAGGYGKAAYDYLRRVCGMPVTPMVKP